MKKAKIVLVIVCLITTVLLCGCSEQTNQNTTTGKTVTMTAEELYNDTETIQGPENITINYKSLNDSDTLIVRNNIFKINYDHVYNKTIVLFVWDKQNSNASMIFEFQGDITGSYSNDEQVKITVKIKKEIFSYQNVTQDMELFEQQWVDENYFNTYRYKPLPPSCISKA